MAKASEFLKESYQEVTKEVTWPTTTELINNTILVLVATLLFALVIGGMDALFKLVMELIYQS